MTTERKETEKAGVSRRRFLKYGAGIVVVGAAAAGAYYYLAAPPGPPPTLTPTETVTAVTTATTSAPVTPTGPIYGGIVLMGHEEAIKIIDPQSNAQQGATWVDMNVLDRLVEYEAGPVGMDIVPSLAEKWEVSSDGAEYTFYLRKGVMWHNGKEFSAEDVKFTFERIRDKGYRKSYIPYVQQVDIIDKYTAKVVNKQPTNFLDAAANFMAGHILPVVTDDDLKTAGITRAEFEEKGFANFLIGTGPFRLKERRLDEYDLFEAYESYWAKDSQGGKYPYLANMKWVPAPEGPVRVANLKSGAYDMITAVPGPDVEDVGNTAGLEVVEKPGAIRADIQFQCQRPPFNDVRMRQAVAYALDPKEIIDLVYQGYADNCRNIIAPWGPFYYDVKDPYTPQDRDKAKELMTAAGYGNGWKGELITFVPEDAVSKVLKDQLSYVGIDLSIRVVDVGVWIATTYPPKSDYNISNITSTFKMDPFISINPYIRTGSEYSLGLYSNPKMDALLDALGTTTDRAKRADIAAQAQQLFVDEVPIYVIGYLRSIYGLHRYVKNFTPRDPYVPYFRETWTEKQA